MTTEEATPARSSKTDVTAQVIMITMKILNLRVLVLLSLLADAAFFAWAAATESWMRLITAVVFAVVAWAVVNVKPPGTES